MKTIQKKKCVLIDICKSDKDFCSFASILTSNFSAKTNHISKIVDKLDYLDAFELLVI